MISRGLFLGLVLILICLGGFTIGCSTAETRPMSEAQAVTIVPTVAVPATAIIPSPASTVTITPVEPSPTASPHPPPVSTATVLPTRGAEAISSQSDIGKSCLSAHPGESPFDALMLPFSNEAQRRRAEQAKSDPKYTKRIDQELNVRRINFLLFGYGETHEPPFTERALIGSQTIISYDWSTSTADVVSLTHDIRAPEIERELAKRGQANRAVRIDQAYNVGGFDLMRKVLENATGLSIDFQVAFKDTVMQRLIDDVFDGVEIDVPMAFDVHPFYLDGIKYERGHFAKGRQRLNGRQVIQFIKTVPVAEAAYDKSLEHNVRKHLVFTALLASVNQKYKERDFWLKGSAFVTRELVTGAVTYDFDPVPLIVNNVGATASNLGRLVKQSQACGIQPPQIKKSIYIVDPAHGDGGVQWVNANAAVNPTTRKDIDSGVYPSLDIEVPLNSNPYGDLITEYWLSVRAIVRQSFLTQAP